MADERIREVVYRIRFKEGGRIPALIFGLVSKAKSFHVETLATNLDEQGNVWRIVHIQGSREDLQKAESAFLADDETTPVLEKRILGRQPHRLVVWYKYRGQHSQGRPSLTHLAFNMLGPETFITDRTVPQGLEVRILAKQGPRLERFVKTLEETAAKDFDFQLVHVGPPRFVEPAGLTREEEEILMASRDVGFFSVPRRGGLRQVASKVNCSLSTASARLRRAEAKLARAYLGDN